MSDAVALKNKRRSERVMLRVAVVASIDFYDGGYKRGHLYAGCQRTWRTLHIAHGTRT